MSVKIEKQENSKVVLEFTMKNEEFRKAVDAAFKKNAAVMAAGVLMPTLSPPNTSNKLMTNGTQLPI